MLFSTLILIAFMIGGIPSSYILVRIIHKKDIRQIGSGNPGATNVFRSIDKKTGWAVLAFDIFKGWLAVAVLTSPTMACLSSSRDTAAFVVGLCAILGHVFSPYLKFKGGKGVATSAGVGLAVFPIPFGFAFIVWAILLRLTRIMSVASIVSAWVFFLSSILFLDNAWHCALAFLVALFITWTHRSNLKRLHQGTEPKFF
ncbi:MAG: glycerol-3-phosphate acyltransferase PlsY [Candidatus Omnitrophota bacterium]|jgi:glycerol-3-phosphate acyltransferase PlsY